MVLPRRRMVRRRRPGLRRRGLRRFPRPMRPMRFRPKVPTFTETFVQNAPTRNVNAGLLAINSATAFTTGKLTVTAADIPQWSDQSKLYRQFRINYVVAYFVPSSTALDVNSGFTSLANGQFAVQTTRIVQAVNDDPNDQTNPANELTVITDNGCKIRQLTRPFKIVFRPKVAVGVVGPGGSTIQAQDKFRQWLPTMDPNAQNAEHFGVDFCASMDVANAGGSDTDIDVARIQYKVNFSLKEPY